MNVQKMTRSAAVIKQISETEKQIAKKAKEVDELLLKRHQELEEIKAAKGKSFRQGGKYYQIRNRKNKDGNFNYIVSSTKKFGSAVKGNSYRKDAAARKNMENANISESA